MSEERELLERVRQTAEDRQEVPWVASMIEEGLAAISAKEERRVAVLREFMAQAERYLAMNGIKNEGLVLGFVGYIGLLLVDLADGTWEPSTEPRFPEDRPERQR